MSELVIRINLDNAAFEHVPKTEIKRILDIVKESLGNNTKNLKDINGNTVGISKYIDSLTIDDIIDMIEKRIKNVKDITRSEQDNLIVLLTYLRSYEIRRD
jgi:hypothetical protein